MEEQENKQDNQEHQEHKKNNVENSFFLKRKQEIAAVVALIIISFLTGLSLWLIALVGLFLMATATMAKKPANFKTLAKVLNISILIFLIYTGIEEVAPRVAEKRENVGDKIDQFFSQNMPNRNEVLAADIFQKEREKAVEDFQPYYRQLLNEGRVDEAADTLLKFEEKWNFRVQLQKAKKSKSLNSENKVEVKNVDTKVLSEEDLKQSSQKVTVIKDSIFYPGTYEIEVRGITDFYVVPTSRNKCQYFTIDSSQKEYQLIFKNGKVYNADSNIREKDLRFRLRATGSDNFEKIIMTIS